ncbi:sugar transferase [Formosa sp. S-31]|uniref:sugar transferase n=1 Tax=Formosa sp. S-31 TaxID=2790949 RepID=UPI003EBE45C8
MYDKIFKRIIDVVVAVFALIILIPVFLILVVVLSVTFKGNPFFRQKRPGKDEKIFNLIKFKSMTDEVDENGELLPYHLRINKIGAFIRAVSLDEIPQLFNVLKGDMSLIGPRPLLVKYLVYYNDYQKQRHSKRPGITGWAQVNGRNSLSWEEKFNLDVWYVNNVTFRTDLKIILLTIKKVVMRENVNQSEGLNMAPFKGNKV